VISLNATLAYRQRPFDIRVVARELGVRYILEGSVRRADRHIRVTGQLTDTETAAIVWAGRFDGILNNIFALQDRLTMSVLAAVEPGLRRAEIERARRRRPENLNAYDLFLRALPLAMTAMPENADRALRYLEEAVQLEPDYAAAHGFIAWCHEQRYLRAGLRPEIRDLALRHAHAAIEAGTDDAMALAMGGFVIGVMERNYDMALEALDRSLALSPSSALAHGFASIIRAWKGDHEAAVEHAEEGIRLGPGDPLIYLPFVGLAYTHVFAGNHAEAVAAAGRASAANPRFSVPRYLHTAALVGLGQIEEARAMAATVLSMQAGFTVTGLVNGNITAPERMAILADALRRAGLPD
jgi:adenylate cyclase